MSRTNRKAITGGRWAAIVAVLAGLLGPSEALAEPPANRAERFQKLRAVAESTGQVPVIVQLEPAAAPQDMLNATARERAVAVLQERRQRIVDDVSLAGRVGNVQRFIYSPSLALSADAAVIDALERHPLVVDIGENRVEDISLAQAVPLVQAPANAWTGGFRGQGQAVAVLDTGVDKNHPLLAGRIVAEACFSTTFSNATTNSTSLCPGGIESTEANSGLHCTGATGCDHGTHVAGIVAARDPGGIGINGVAPDASIIAMQVFSRFDTGCGSVAPPCVRTFLGDQIQALERVFALRNTFSIASVNMSLGGGQFFSACDADARKPIIDSLRAAGIAVVIANGNDGFRDSLGAPACISSSISVGATCDTQNNSACTLGVDSVASYSNITSFTSLVAPGSLILSSVPGGGLANFNGTSMATPMVAGAWALKRQQNPAASVSDILADFRASGVSVNDTRTSGVVAGLRRIRFATPPPSPCTYSLSPTGQSLSANVGGNSFTVTTQATCPWTAVANAAFITTSSSGVGNGTVSYTVQANPTTSERVGTIAVGGQTFTVTQAGLEGIQDLVQNGGFEAGDSPWVQTSSITQAIITTRSDLAFRGSRLAWLGGYNAGTDAIRQDVAIPANAGTAWLMFGYRVATEEPTTGELRPDRLTVTVSSPTNPPEFPPAEVFYISNVDADNTYQEIAPINISRFAGKAVRISFTATLDADHSTSFFIDDVKLLVSAPTSDTVPDPFTIAPQVNVPLSSERTSAPVQPTGFDSGTTIGVSGVGRYSIGCTSAYTAESGTLLPGQSVCLRHTSAATPGTSVSTRLVIGGISAEFVSTTAGPLQIVTTTLPDGSIGSVYSQTIVVSGGTPPYAHSVSAGTLPGGLSLNAGTGTLSGTPIASGSFNFTVTATDATSQAVSQPFTLAIAARTSPDPFSFAPQRGVPVSSTRTSNTVTPTGFNVATSISVTSGLYSIGCADSGFTATAGTLQPGQSVCVRHTAAASPNATVTTRLTIGGVGGDFSSTTASPEPAAAASVTSVDFGNQAVGTTSSSRSVSIINGGGGTLQVTSVTSTRGQFGVSHNCAALSAGASCPVSLTFAPGEIGAQTAALNVVTSAGPLTVSLAGNGVSPPVTAITRLTNISTRAFVQTDDKVMIGGFVVGGGVPKRVLITARGPSLAPFGITNFLANPKIELFQGSTKLLENDNWQAQSEAAGGNASVAAIQALGIFPSGLAPSDANEAALLVTLNPGAFTVVVSGSTGGTGVGIVEVFEQDGPSIPLANISTRGEVLTGNNVMIAGFVVTGSSPQQVLITARGPSLAGFGIANPLANPKIEIFRGSSKLHENDDWQSQNAAAGGSASVLAIQALGVFPNGLAPSSASEAALLVTLEPGAYTAIVSGVSNGTGVAIVEVFAR